MDLFKLCPTHLWPRPNTCEQPPKLLLHHHIRLREHGGEVHLHGVQTWRENIISSFILDSPQHLRCWAPSACRPTCPPPPGPSEVTIALATSAGGWKMCRFAFSSSWECSDTAAIWQIEKYYLEKALKRPFYSIWLNPDQCFSYQAKVLLLL